MEQLVQALLRENVSIRKDAFVLGTIYVCNEYCVTNAQNEKLVQALLREKVTHRKVTFASVFCFCCDSFVYRILCDNCARYKLVQALVSEKVTYRKEHPVNACHAVIIVVACVLYNKV